MDGLLCPFGDHSVRHCRIQPHSDYQENLRKSVIEVETEKARLVVEKTKAFFEKVTSNLLFITKDTRYQTSDYSHIKEHFKNLLSENDYLTPSHPERNPSLGKHWNPDRIGA